MGQEQSLTQKRLQNINSKLLEDLNSSKNIKHHCDFSKSNTICHVLCADFSLISVALIFVQGWMVIGPV